MLTISRKNLNHIKQMVDLFLIILIISCYFKNFDVFFLIFLISLYVCLFQKLFYFIFSICSLLVCMLFHICFLLLLFSYTVSLSFSSFQIFFNISIFFHLNKPLCRTTSYYYVNLKSSLFCISSFLEKEISLV